MRRWWGSKGECNCTFDVVHVFCIDGGGKVNGGNLIYILYCMHKVSMEENALESPTPIDTERENIAKVTR